MAPNAKKNGCPAGASQVVDWKSILRLDQGKFEILQKKVKLPFNKHFPIPDPTQRLVVILRYLVTGEGFHESLLEMLESTFDAMLESLEGNLKWPKNKAKWRLLAQDFQDKWNASNCLGSVVQKRILVESKPDVNWMFVGSGSSDSHFLFRMAVDANYRAFFLSLDCPGVICPDNDQLLQEIQDSKAKFPTGTEPFTFAGSNQLLPHESIRRTSDAKDDDRQAIQQGLRPAEIAYQVLLSRFSVLKSKLLVTRFERIAKMCKVIVCLHNYFLNTNSEYVKDVEEMASTLAIPEEEEEKATVSTKVVVPRRVPAEEKAWMDKMHLNGDTYQCLLDLALPHMLKYSSDVPPDMRLRVALRYMATGTGFDAKIDGMIDNTYSAIDKGLQEYAATLPFPEKKWLKIAADFDRKRNLPNCVGVIAPEMFMVMDKTPGLGCMVMVLDVSGRISYSQLIKKSFGMSGVSMSVMEPVDQFLKKNAFQLPSKRLFFIGCTYNSTPTLATYSRPGHFTQIQMDLGRALEHTFHKAVKARFEILNYKCDEMATCRGSGVVLALSKMHNFLMDKSSTYGDVFKGQWTMGVPGEHNMNQQCVIS